MPSWFDQKSEIQGFASKKGRNLEVISNALVSLDWGGPDALTFEI